MIANVWSSLSAVILDGILMLGLAALLLGLVAAILESRCHAEREKRWLWRSALILLAITLLAELLGIGKWFSIPTSRTALITQESSSPQHLAGAAKHLPPPIQFPSSTPGELLLTLTPSLRVPLGVVLGVIWITISIALLLRVFLAHVLLQRLRCRLLPITSPDTVATLKSLIHTMNLSPSLRIGCRTGLQAPFVFGLLRPTLVLPREFPASLSPAHQRAVILHELAHLADNDPRWQLLADLLFAALWWHPACWMLHIKWRQVTESAADEATQKMVDGPVLLAESLLTWQRLKLIPAWRPGLSVLSRSGSRLSRRINLLLDTRPAHSQTSGWRAVSRGVRTSLLAFTIMMVMIGASGARLHSVKEDEPMTGLKVLRHSVLGLAILAASESPTQAQGAIVAPASGTPRSVTAAGKSEEGAILAMALNAQEIATFRALQAEREKKMVAFRQMGNGPERSEAGKAIGNWYRASTQNILSPEQYGRYLEYWQFNQVALKFEGQPGSSAYQAVVTPHPFDLNTALLKDLKLSEEQVAKIMMLRADMAKNHASMNGLVKDPKNLGEFDSLVARTQKQRNDRLKSILSAEQYQQYRTILGEIIQANLVAASSARAQGGIAAPVK